MKNTTFSNALVLFKEFDAIYGIAMIQFDKKTKVVGFVSCNFRSIAD
jgi:hypothetical protein